MKKVAQKKSVISTDSLNGSSFIGKKLPTWAAEGLCFPTRLSMEQCSGEEAARYKSEIVSRLFPSGGDKMADLTGGLGVDFSQISPHFRTAYYIERQTALCEAAKQNFTKLGLNNAVILEGDGTELLSELPELDLIFIDPARRDNIGRKTVFIEDCEPDITRLLPFLWKKTKCLVLKLSPMLDLNRALTSLKYVSEAHIVAEGGECKELLLVLQPEYKSTPIYCADGDQKFTFYTEEEAKAIPNYTSEPRQYLYEPGASLLKAGAFKLISQRFHIEKLHPNSHLYTSDQLIEDFPGRSFEIVQVSGFAKKALKDLCNTVDKANLTIRNFPGSVAELRKRLKLKEGGDAYWFATTLNNGKHVIIDCRKIKRNM